MTIGVEAADATIPHIVHPDLGEKAITRGSCLHKGMVYIQINRAVP